MYQKIIEQMFFFLVQLGHYFHCLMASGHIPVCCVREIQQRAPSYWCSSSLSLQFIVFLSFFILFPKSVPTIHSHPIPRSNVSPRPIFWRDVLHLWNWSDVLCGSRPGGPDWPNDLRVPQVTAVSTSCCQLNRPSNNRGSWKKLRQKCEGCPT